jgi:hypothetical protein
MQETIMTEFELSTLIQGQVNSVLSSYYYFYSILSAFVIVSYLAAHRLSAAMAFLMTGLFALNQFYLLSVIGSQLQALGAMIAEMGRLSNAGGFRWLGPISTPGSANIYAPLIILLVSLLASIYFFFHCRRANGKAEAKSATS